CATRLGIPSRRAQGSSGSSRKCGTVGSGRLKSRERVEGLAVNQPVVFVDVDTQVDFMLPTGRLYVPGAEQIIPNLRKLMACARERGILVLSSADAHPPDDASFAQWPPHCVVGTPGQRRIPETQLASETVISNRPGVFTPPKKWEGQFVIEIEKQDYSVAGNPNLDAIIAALGPCHLLLFGCGTEDR